MISALDSAIEKNKRIGISGHVRPDGDCVGSCLGVYTYIKDRWPDKDLHVYLEEIPHIFDFLPNAEEIERPGTDRAPFDLFIALDCGEIGRLGKSGAYFKDARSTLCIDHHLPNKGPFSDTDLIEPDASSACELVFLQMDKPHISKEIAMCLYTGMVTDTGIFQYSSTSSRTMETAGFLMDKGINFPAIVDRVFNEKSIEQNRAMGIALSKAELHLDGQVISSYLTREEMKSVSALPKHMEGIVSQLRVTKGVEAAVFLYEAEDGSFKGSLRSKEKVNVAFIARLHDGGGHERAAGFTWKGDPKDAVNTLVREIGEALHA